MNITITILINILCCLVVGAVLLAIIINYILNKNDSIKLVQGKLENSSSAISDAMVHLKLTNEWSKQNDDSK